jgi:cytochrome P450 family 4
MLKKSFTFVVVPRSKMLLISVLVLIATFLVWVRVKTRRKNELLSRIPSRKRKFLLENSMEFYGKTSKGVFDLFEEMKNELGSIYAFSFSAFDGGYVMISDPKLAEIVLLSQKLIDKGYDYESMRDWLGNGLLLSTGKKWQQRRKILTPTFHFQILEKFVEIMDEQSRILVAKLERTNGKEVDIFPHLSLFALDVICGENDEI